MFDFPGYTFTDQLHEGRNTLVVRAVRKSDDAAVILKALIKRNPDPHEAVQLHHEYDMLKLLEYVPGVVAAQGVERALGIHALVLKDEGGTSLRSLIKASRRDLELFFTVALNLTSVLKSVHDTDILHKDINPNNILYLPDAKSVSLIDFGSATRLSRSQAAPLNPALIEGTLAYIAPEQTGRMNRSIDYRSDYYALGITLYELLLGIQPFRSSDPMEQIHSHIAQKPVPPNVLNRDIPVELSEVILKLIAKHPEERYQSAEGILADLKACRDIIDTNQTHTDFIPGKREVLRRLRIPEKLFGREEEVKALEDAFQSTLEGREKFLLISGEAGVGKSVLVNELHKPVMKENGLFVVGKFDQLQRNIPYFSVSRAFEGLVRDWLSQDSATMNSWRSKLEEELGSNIPVLVQIIPEMEYLLGEQPEPAELPDAETKNRLREVFGKFIRSIATSEHPLVLFMDDLQWADGASIQLLETLLTDSFDTHMLVIGTYRPQEATANTQLMTSFANLEEQGFERTDIHLKPLSEKAVRQMIAETVHQETAVCELFADLIFSKTGGNPFFIGEFISSLREKELLHFDFGDQNWHWSLSDIAREDITDNVVDLVTEKITRLSSESQKTLTLAACIGTDFELGMLMHVGKQTLLEVVQNLEEAIEHGMVYPKSDNYAYLSRLADETKNESYKLPEEYEELAFSFSHDRVQQAAYGLIPPDATGAMHLKIGRRMMEITDGVENDDVLFELLAHINKGISGVKHIDDRKQIAELNLLAGRKAIASVAYEPAMQFLTAASTVLNDENRTHDYELCIAVELELAHSALLNGLTDEAEKRLNDALEFAEADLDKARIIEMLVRMHIQNADYEKAFDIALEGLAYAGVKFPAKANKLQAGKEVLLTRIALRGKKVEDLINLPEMKREESKIALHIHSSIQGVAYGKSEELSGINICKQLLMVLKHGISAEASNAFSLYGVLLAIGLGNYTDARAFVNLGVRNAEKFEDNFHKGRALFMMASSVNHWTRPVASNLDLLAEAAILAEESGDILYQGFCLTQTANVLTLQGGSLDNLRERIEGLEERANRMRFVPAQHFLDITQHYIEALQGKTEHHTSLQSETFDESFYLEGKQDASLGWVMIWFLQQKLFLGLLYGEFDNKIIELAETYRHNVLGQFSEAEYLFVRALTLIRSSRSERNGKSGVLSRKASSEIKTIQRRYRKWKTSVPENFLAKYLLVEAERSRLARRDAEAMQYYDEAIEAAAKYGHLRDEALSNELAALFFQDLGRVRQAALYMQEAVYCYSRWQAWAKVEQLREDFEDLLSGGDTRSFFSNTGNRSLLTDTTETIAVELDIATIMKSAQVISQEIVLGPLLKKLMHIVMENAGAARGSLIMENDGALEVEAYGEISEGEITVLESVPLEESSKLAVSVVNLVARKRDPIVLDDASGNPAYLNDAYVQENKVKSMLCMPVLNQNKLVAVLYLENNLVTGAFTPERLQILKMLSTDIAISIENARLYARLEEYSHTLEDRVKERTKDLQQRSEELQSALEELKNAQTRLVHSQKMASLGELTAGIAHEIKNPLNFINNFAQLATSLVTELDDMLQKPDSLEEEAFDDAKDIMLTLRQNTEKITEHGKRADDIVKSMLMHSREKTGSVQSYKVNKLLEDSLKLAQQSHFAQYPDIRIRFRQDLNEDVGEISGVPQDLSRAFLNLLTNACHAVRDKAQHLNNGVEYTPSISISSKRETDSIVIKIRDNGNGIPQENIAKVFNPFFTTKPAGEGTGLGLSITYDVIVQEHQGMLEVFSEEGEYCEMVVSLPLQRDEDRTNPMIN